MTTTPLSTVCRRALIILPLLLMPLLMGCAHAVAVNDPAGQCAHPPLPEKPYTDHKRATLIIRQAQAIDVCRALLGH
ncbi:MAG: hypothetical protein WC130_03825 [Kiritimatiellia bacterium]